MQKLAESIKQSVADAKVGYTPDLLDASKEWASYCLENMVGDLLGRGLAISQAIAHFDAGMKHPEILKD